MAWQLFWLKKMYKSATLPHRHATGRIVRYYKLALFHQNPSELLASKKMGHLIKELEEVFDFNHLWLPPIVVTGYRMAQSDG